MSADNVTGKKTLAATLVDLRAENPCSKASCDPDHSQKQTLVLSKSFTTSFHRASPPEIHFRTHLKHSSAFESFPLALSTAFCSKKLLSSSIPFLNPLSAALLLTSALGWHSSSSRRIHLSLIKRQIRGQIHLKAENCRWLRARGTGV